MDELISRQAAIDAMFAGMPGLMFNDVLRILRTLPTAQPERKTGRWILKPYIYGVAYCSECDYAQYINNTNYCPNCGADMRGEQDE